MLSKLMQNFELILLWLTLLSGLIALIDVLFFSKARWAKAREASDFDSLDKKAREKRVRAPYLADCARSFFPVFLLVLLIRSFGVEAYRVPTGSMLPTIQLNDFVLIDKFSYGLRWPLSHQVLWPVGSPKRGDVLVFFYPAYPRVNMVKTVIGLPGDHVSLVNKHLFLNGQAVKKEFLGEAVEVDNRTLPAVSVEEAQKVNAFEQTLGNLKHHIYESPSVSPTNFVDLVVPPHHYFMMGDNRDNSDDSRYWGFVPEENVVGKAFLVLFSWDSEAFNFRWDRFFHRLV